MVERVQWVKSGRWCLTDVCPGAGEDENDPLLRQGMVKITEDDRGTTIRWAMFSSNWASLYFVAEWLSGRAGPFHLQFYSAGWFNERHDDCWTAADRLQQLIPKSDVHLSRSVYIDGGLPAREGMPVLLQQALCDGIVSEDHSIDCAYDPSARRFRVARIGPKSTIARLWGLSPGCYPCRAGHAYDKAVSLAYPEVMRSGQPHYDHVYAALASSRGEMVWVPYQRVVLPLARSGNRTAVRIITEVARVDISPL